MLFDNTLFNLERIIGAQSIQRIIFIRKEIYKSSPFMPEVV